VPQISREQRTALLIAQRIAEAVIATVNEMPNGAPSGPIYAVLMPHMSLSQYETLMRTLVEAQRIARRGDLYFPAP
jgi:hypothetical protein